MKPRYMIHTIPERMWYVKGYLIPELIRQGIPKSRIKVWNDKDHMGNLVSCITSFLWCGEQVKDHDKLPKPHTWHIQDDVVPSKVFAQVTEFGNEFNMPVVAGFCADLCYGEDRSPYKGFQPIDKLWWSFQCIRIDDWLAGECGRWFMAHEGSFGQDMDILLREGKGDDTLFSLFLKENHPKMKVFNGQVNLVQHIDDLLGGSVVNKGRDFAIRSKYWTDHGEMDKVKEWLEVNRP